MAGQISLMAIYRRLFAAWMGETAAGSLRSLNWGLADLKRLGLSVGARVTLEYPAEFRPIRGTAVSFRVYRALGATQDGGLLKSYAGAAGRLSTVQTPYKKSKIATTQTLKAEDVVGGLLEFTAGTGVNQQPRVIMGADGVAAASTLTIAKRDSQLRMDPESAPEALGTTPDGTTTVGAFCDWEYVEAGAAATDLVAGVALGVVTSGNYSILVERGYVPALVDGSQAGRGGTTSVLLIPGAAGVAWPITAAGVVAADAAYNFGRLIHAYTGSSAKRLIHLHGRFAA